MAEAARGTNRAKDGKSFPLDAEEGIGVSNPAVITFNVTAARNLACLLSAEM